MSPLARVVDEHVGLIAVAAVRGEVDASNARELGERLHAALTNRSRALIVDLGETSYLDSAGVNLLFAMDLELRERRQRLHLVVPAASPIARVVSITALDRAVSVHETLEAALEAGAADDT